MRGVGAEKVSAERVLLTLRTTTDLSSHLSRYVDYVVTCSKIDFPRMHLEIRKLGAFLYFGAHLRLSRSSRSPFKFFLVYL
jgi:hypothetical protein